MAGPPASWRTIPMRSRLRRRLARGIVVLPLALAGCSGMQQAFYESDPAAYDFPNFNGVPQDKQKAFELFDYAWSKGVKQAAYPLARAYDEGVPVKADRSRALELYRAAAKNGDARAHLRLAELEAEDGAPKEQVYDEA